MGRSRQGGKGELMRGAAGEVRLTWRRLRTYGTPLKLPMHAQNLYGVEQESPIVESGQGTVGLLISSARQLETGFL